MSLVIVVLIAQTGQIVRTSDLFTNDIRLIAANGTFIRNKGECGVSFKIGQERFRFPFLCSDQLSQELILGHNFA